MKAPDLDKARSEKKLTQRDFLLTYNKDLPEAFPRASLTHLNTFQQQYPSLFKGDMTWTLDLHRKRFMDWLPAHLKALEV